MSDYLQADSMRLGWALIHFLWQGVVIVAMLKIVLMLAPRKQASLRYFLCGVALAAMPVCLVVTYSVLGGNTPFGAPTVESHESASVTSLPKPPVDPVSAPFAGPIAEFTSGQTPAFDLNRCMPWVVAGWLMGVVLLAGRKAGGFLVLWRLRRRGVSTPGDVISELFQRASVKIGVDPRRVCLKISSLVDVPMTMGWVRPVVLFPAVLLSGLSTGEIELLLAHELAHIRRCDYLINLLQTVVETLFFYHPVTWWISHRMRQERENACDDLVASLSTEKLAYAKALLRLESIRPAQASLASAANGGNLLQRIQRLSGEPAPGSGMGLPILLALLSILGVVAAVSVVEAQQAPSGKPPLTMTAAEAKSRGVAALVNGHPIPWSDLKASGDDRPEALQYLIDQELVFESFRNAGKTVPESWVEKQINDFVKSNYGGDRQAYLKAMNQTEEQEKQKLREEYMRGERNDSQVFFPRTWKYFQDHTELFPQYEQINVTLITIECPTGQPPHDHAGNPNYLVAQQVLDQVGKGADFPTLAAQHPNHRYAPDPTLWLTKEGILSLFLRGCPDLWPAIEKLQPGQTSGIIEGMDCYYIARVNERRPARIASTDETTKQEGELVDAENKKNYTAWISGLRAQAQIQTFAEAEVDGAASIIKVSDVPPDPTPTNSAPMTSTGQPDAIPVAQPVPATPVPAFAQPVTMKEGKEGDKLVSRRYFQGGDLVLEQDIGASSGSIGQIVFYDHTPVVVDTIGLQPMATSSRTIEQNNLNIYVQSIAADSVSPAKLRILNTSHEIITEFFIDNTGLMRPITKAEHDADLARRKAALDNKPPSSTTTTAEPGKNSASGADTVSILHAVYEAKDGAGSKDVTDSVTEMLKNNHLQVTVGNSTLGGDPAYLHTKQLRVEYLEKGQKQVAIAKEGMTLTIPPESNGPVAAPGGQGENGLANNFGQLFNQVGKMMTNEAKVMAQQMASSIPPVQTNVPGGVPTPGSAQQSDDPFALPVAGTFGQLGRVMEIHVTSSRQIGDGVRAVHYYSQYRELPAGSEAGVTWGGEIAVYGLSPSIADGESWKGLVYPAGHMTFASGRLSVYATTKEQARSLAQNESEQDRKSFPP